LTHSDDRNTSYAQLWCKPLKGASKGRGKLALQRLFTKHVENRNQKRIAGRKTGNEALGEIKRAVTLVML
jgi:hypothetical protein